MVDWVWGLTLSVLSRASGGEWRLGRGVGESLLRLAESALVVGAYAVVRPANEGGLREPVKSRSAGRGWSWGDGCVDKIIYTLSNDVDLLNPLVEVEKRKYKLKRLVQSPNSNFFFMDVKCQGCIFKQEMHSEEEDRTV
ncbi:40S ribosomal protein S27-2 [Tanacetum coccineum]